MIYITIAGSAQVLVLPKQQKTAIMYLVDWLQANLLMVFTTLVLIGIPAIIGIVVFNNMSKKKGGDTDATE
ncbi:MAG TPA: hypothetical protein PK198_16320 [Saprospiraceae bacterium]|nr:hypothetical protein [Saprospiraceae bacterium]HRK80568.1 hypothetical protein [Saprospiraceae bacterium]